MSLKEHDDNCSTLPKLSLALPFSHTKIHSCVYFCLFCAGLSVSICMSVCVSVGFSFSLFLAHTHAHRLPKLQYPSQRRYLIAAQTKSPTYQELAAKLSPLLPPGRLAPNVDVVPAPVTDLIVKGISLGDPSLGELLAGVRLAPNGASSNFDVEPMLSDLVSPGPALL